MKTPVVSTACPTGPEEILIDDFAKFLVSLEQSEDEIVIEISNKIKLAIYESEKLKYNEVICRFDQSVIFNEWNKYFHSILSINKA